MNNNNQNKGKESDIITKKGFMISLPGKKSSAETQSSINLAKPQGNAPHSEKNDGATEKKNFHGNKKNNRHNRHNRRDKNNRTEIDRNEKTENNNISEQKTQNNCDNKPQKENKHENKHENKNRNKKHKSFSKDSSRVKHERSYDETSSAAEKKENVRDLRLSPSFSKDINKHGESKTSSFAKAEPSLEEKYKNAKPLSEQIREQELRQKGIKIPDGTEELPEVMQQQEIIGVRFREAGKVYYFDPMGTKVSFGAPVIVETARGSEYGITVISNRMIPVDTLTSPLKKLERLATVIDTQKHEANKMLEKDAEAVFLEKVAKLGLPMTLIYVEYTFDNTRLLFYFTAETRVDFRELVKELAGVFRTRIELRQIGVRDEAKMIGGMGVCGRATCCNTFLGDFAQVSIKMAKDQSLSLNAAKISGACGKLMCCLRYEDKVYEEENARTPKVGSIVETSEGKGVVVERNALKGVVNVVLDATPDAPAKPFPREEVMVIGYNKEKGEDDRDLEELKSLQDS